MKALLWLAALLHTAAACLAGYAYACKRRRTTLLLLGGACLFLACHAFVTLARPAATVGADVLLFLVAAVLAAVAAGAAGRARPSACRLPGSMDDQSSDDLPIGLFAVNPDGDITDANPAAAAILGYSDASTLLGLNACELCVDPPLREDAVERIGHESGVIDFEVRLKKADGTPVWVQGDARAVRDRTGRVTSYVGCLVDITRHRETEELLVIQRDLALSLSGVTELRDGLEHILDAAVRIRGIDCGGVYLVDARTEALHMVCHRGLPDSFVESVRDLGRDTPQARLVRTGKPLFGLHLELLPQTEGEARAEELRALAVLPVKHAGQVTAVLNLGSHTERELSAAVRNALESIAAELGAVIRRMQAQDQLRKSEQRFRMILDATSDGVWDRDVHTGTCYYSPQWARMLGYRSEELAPTLATWDELLHPEDRPRVVSALEDHLAGRTARYIVEFRMRHKDGGWRWVLSRGRVVDHDDAGRPRRILGTHTDISDWKRTEQNLRESRERFRGLVEALPDLVFLFDEEGRCLDVIAGDEDLLYRAAAEVKGKSLRDIFPERQADEFMELHRRTFEADTPQTYEYQIPVPAGLRWFEARTAVLHDVDEGKRRLISTVRDVTARKQAEQEQRRLEAQVLQAQKLESLGVLAGGVAHDFNNLLTGILGNVDLALDDVSPVSPVVERIRDIEKSANRAADLARQMLAYSGKGSFVIEAIDMNEVVQEMEHLLTSAMPRKIALRYETAPALPAIRGDATQIRQVAMNLVRNASDAIGDNEGTIVIRTGVMDCRRGYLRRTVLDEALPEGTYAFLEVEDTGCGMDRETQKRVFDPFYSTKLTGRGLGLAALMGIVRGHRGAVHVDSTPGRGSAFRILLPALDLPAPPRVREQRDVDAWSGSGTVLVVEDEQSVRQAAQVLLERLGFSVVTADDGVEGVEAFREHTDDLICVLLDLTMPRMDGREAFDRMTQIRPDVPVIVTSGYSEAQVRARFAAAPASDFLRKPYRLADLRRALRNVLGDVPGTCPEQREKGADTEAETQDAR